MVVYLGLRRPVLPLQLERSVLPLQLDSVVQPPPRTRRSPQDRRLECHPEGRVGGTASSKGSTIQHSRRSQCRRPPLKWQWLKLRAETVAPVSYRSPLETRPQSGADDVRARDKKKTCRCRVGVAVVVVQKKKMCVFSRLFHSIKSTPCPGWVISRACFSFFCFGPTTASCRDAAAPSSLPLPCPKESDSQSASFSCVPP